jgi:serine/threonine-protein kinase
LAALEHERPNISAGSYLSFRAHAEAINGHPRARETLAELRQVAETEYVTPYFIAMVHSALGDATEAIEELERAVRERDPQVGTMNVDPRFAPIRRDPRFQALIARLEFPNPER